MSNTVVCARINLIILIARFEHLKHTIFFFVVVVYVASSSTLCGQFKQSVRIIMYSLPGCKYAVCVLLCVYFPKPTIQQFECDFGGCVVVYVYICYVKFSVRVADILTVLGKMINYDGARFLVSNAVYNMQDECVNFSFCVAHKIAYAKVLFIIFCHY